MYLFHSVVSAVMPRWLTFVPATCHNHSQMTASTITLNSFGDRVPPCVVPCERATVIPVGPAGEDCLLPKVLDQTEHVWPYSVLLEDNKASWPDQCLKRLL